MGMEQAIMSYYHGNHIISKSSTQYLAIVFLGLYTSPWEGGSISRTRNITSGKNSHFKDVVHIRRYGVMCFINAAITSLQNPPSTCDIVNIKTVEDVNTDIGEIKGEGCFPSDAVTTGHKIVNGSK